jgi:hypothetical protein
LPRLRQTRWLLFCCIISEIGERWAAWLQPDELRRRDLLRFVSIRRDGIG